MAITLEAIWSLEILSETRVLNAGVLFFQPRRLFGDFYESGRIVGGDRRCVYSGTYTVENHALTGDMKIVPYSTDTDPVFGCDAEMHLEFSGTLDRAVERDVLELSGNASQQVLRLRLVRRVPLS